MHVKRIARRTPGSGVGASSLGEDGRWGRKLRGVLGASGPSPVVPDGIRTRVTGLKGQRPGPLDDRDDTALHVRALEPLAGSGRRGGGRIRSPAVHQVRTEEPDVNRSDPRRPARSADVPRVDGPPRLRTVLAPGSDAGSRGPTLRPRSGARRPRHPHRLQPPTRRHRHVESPLKASGSDGIRRTLQRDVTPAVDSRVRCALGRGRARGSRPARQARNRPATRRRSRSPGLQAPISPRTMPQARLAGTATSR